MESLESRKLFAVMTPTFMMVDHSAGSGTFHPFGSSSPSGLSPAIMRKAYGVDVSAFGSVVGDGTGQTIAIVDAYDLPTAASDLAAFSAQFGLPNPTFTKINQTGGTSLPAADAKGGWGVETALDIEWAHAIAPKANILLVEANSAFDSDLFQAVDTARNYPGVSVISMSWGGDEASNDSSNDGHFLTPSGHNGVTFVASSGDAGAYSYGTSTKSVSYPAASKNIVSVGGTFLTTNNGTYVSESGWGSGTTSGTNGGGGGGISKYIAQPLYQKGVVSQSTTFRTVPDVAMDADPNSGAAVYDAYDNGTAGPWIAVGGTSLASPMFAGVIAIANQGRVLNGLTTLDGSTATLPALYQLPTTDFHDITTGNNGFAAAAGYDLVTGRGTPIVNLLTKDLSGSPTNNTPTIGSLTSSPPSVVSGASFTLTAANVTETGGTISKVTFYRESNGTSGLQPTADTLVGTGTNSGTSWSITVSSTGLAVGNYTYYAVATDANNVNSAAASTVVTVTSSTGGSTPTIGSLSANPTSVTVGANFALTAANVTETNGTISRVTFYRESNGTTGLQLVGDTNAGLGTQSGTSWSINLSSSNLAAGTYTFYAVATDANNVVSAAASTTLIVNPVPVTGELIGWNVSGQTGFGTQGLAASKVVAGITNSLGLTRGSGLSISGSPVSNAWGATSFSSTSATGISTNDTISFGLTVSAGQTVSLSSIDLRYRHSTTGPVNGLWQYKLNTGAWTTIADIANEFSSSSSNGASMPKLNLATVAALQNVAAGTQVTFRVVPYGSSGSSGTWYVYDQTGDDLIVSGTITKSTAFDPLFSNAVKSAIALVPTTAGLITSTSVVDFGKTVYKGSLNVANTLNRIRANGKGIDANDGTIYTNANKKLPAGTWYEFVVDPKTGTNRNFGSSISFPGPMRLLLSTTGMVYFTGDHYSNFDLVYKPSSIKASAFSGSSTSDGDESETSIEDVDSVFATQAYILDLETV